MKVLIVTLMIVLILFTIGCDTELGHHENHDHEGDEIPDHIPEEHEEEHGQDLNHIEHTS